MNENIYNINIYTHMPHTYYLLRVSCHIPLFIALFAYLYQDVVLWKITQ